MKNKRICFCILSLSVILNSNDFDFLLSRGSNSDPSPRDSILERFDPILGRKSIVPAPLINNTEPKNISTILEVDSIAELSAAPPTESLISTESVVVEANVVVNNFGDNEESAKQESNERFEQSIGGDGDISQASNTTETHESVVEANAVVNNFGDNEETAKLESSDKIEQSIGGDGDISQASSTTETYETASIGEPLKVIHNLIIFNCHILIDSRCILQADVTMSVGLIHDLKMDNMKSLEQDKVEPNLKMNDEHKVKQEMLVLINLIHSIN